MELTGQLYQPSPNLTPVRNKPTQQRSKKIKQRMGGEKRGIVMRLQGTFPISRFSESTFAVKAFVLGRNLVFGQITAKQGDP